MGLSGLCDRRRRLRQEGSPASSAARREGREVLQRDVPVYVEAIGETRGNTEIEIRARVEGFIESVDYKEGTLVKKGQLLYTIDARPSRRPLARTKASQAEAEAAARARAPGRRRATSRWSRRTRSRARSTRPPSRSRRPPRPRSKRRKAVVERAEIDLSYTQGARRPRTAWRAAPRSTPGTLVGRGQSTLLTRISRIDPIHVRFSFPERDYLAYARKRGSGVGSEAAARERALRAGRWPTAACTPQPGTLVFVDRNVDAQTGTIMAEVAFANPDEILRPGQYARVRATIEQRKGAILVPQRAVQELQGVFSVMVVRRGRHGRAAPRDAGRAHRLAVGDRLGPEGRRARRRRGPAEGAAGA